MNELVCKITYQSANPRDLIAFQSSLAMLPHIKCILSDLQTPLLKELYEELDTLEDLCKLVSDSIREDPPIAMKEGGIIKDGYNAEVDKLRNAKSDGKDWLAKLETDERKRQESRICVSNTTKYLAIIWKLPILLKIWYRIIIQESRLLPMQSVISFRN